MKKRLLWIFSVLVVVFAIGITIVIWFDNHRSNNEVSGKDADSEESDDTGKKSGTDHAMEENPFGDHLNDDALSDEDFLKYIHGMSHQKVKADEKWSFYEITDERIEWLWNALDKSDSNLGKEKDIYRDILERWSNGNFSQVDKDHNEVWQMQGGNVGEATGILNEEEEQEVIEKHKEGSTDNSNGDDS